MGQRLPSPLTTPSQPLTTAKPLQCQTTEICKKTCKYNVKIGKPGPDGCPTCLCVMTPTSKVLLYLNHEMCIIIAHFTCIMCKMACKATNGIYGGQSYKCDKDVCPTPIIFNFLNIGIIFTFPYTYNHIG